MTVEMQVQTAAILNVNLILDHHKTDDIHKYHTILSHDYLISDTIKHLGNLYANSLVLFVHFYLY